MSDIGAGETAQNNQEQKDAAQKLKHDKNKGHNIDAWVSEFEDVLRHGHATKLDEALKMLIDLPETLPDIGEDGAIEKSALIAFHHPSNDGADRRNLIIGKLRKILHRFC